MQAAETKHSRFKLFGPEYSFWLPQIGAGTVLAFEIVLAIYDSSLALLLSPVAIGCLFPLFWWFPRPAEAVEQWGPFLEFRRDRAAFGVGMFASARRHTWAGGHAIWRLATPIRAESVRAGVRVALLLYYFGMFAIVGAFLAYIALALLVAVVILIVILAAFLLWLHISDSDGDSMPGNIAETRYKSGFFGLDPHLEHVDKYGNKIGETRHSDGFLGLDPHLDHTDDAGRKVGETHDSDGFLGLDRHMEHTDDSGRKVGESRHSDGFLGLDPHMEHTDKHGRKIGESRQDDGFLGLDPHSSHTEP